MNEPLPSRLVSAHVWALAGYLACFWVAPSSKFQDRWVYFIIAPLALATVIRYGTRLRQLPNRKPFYLLVALSALLVLPVFWGDHRESLPESLRQELKDYGFVLALLLNVTVASLRHRTLHQTVVPLLAVVAVAACAPVAYRLLFGDGVATDGLTGLGNLANNPNETGLMAGAAALTLLAWWLAGRANETRRHTVAAAGLALALLAVYASEARSAWFALPVGILALLVFRYRLWKTTLTMAVVTLILAASFHEPLLEHVSSLSLSGRSTLWAEIFALVDDQWLLGAGLNDTVNTFNPATNREEEPHSLYIALFYRGGAFALALFLGMVLFALIPVVRGRKSVNPFYVGLLFYGLTNQLVEGVYPVNNPNAFWLFTWIPVMILALRPDSARNTTDSHDAISNEPAV